MYPVLNCIQYHFSMLDVWEQSTPSGAYRRHEVPSMSTIRSTEELFPCIQIGGLHVDFLVILIYVTQAHDLTCMQI